MKFTSKKLLLFTDLCEHEGSFVLPLHVLVQCDVSVVGGDLGDEYRHQDDGDNPLVHRPVRGSYYLHKLLMNSSSLNVC